MDMGDGISARRAAELLGTSVPRVKRAIARSGLKVREGPRGRVRLTRRQLVRLRDELGTGAHVPGLGRSEVRLLATLARAPLGLVSIRAAAARAGLSPTAAGRAIESLERKGLARRERTWVAAGRAREIDLLKANYAHPRWGEIAPSLAHVQPPARVRPPTRAARPARRRRVPAHLRHLFWNTAPSQLDTDRAGPYIARRLLQVRDLEGLAWGAEHLTRADWLDAAEARGLDPRQRALARNLAEAAGRR